MANPQIKMKENVLMMLLDKLEMDTEALGNQDELLKIISDRSSFWSRLHQVIYKLERLESFLAVRK